MPPKHRYPPPQEESDSDEEMTEDEEFEDEEEEIDLVEVMNDMPLDTRRRVYAIKGHTKEFQELMVKFREEVATLELELLAKRQPLYAKRREIVLGERECTEEEVTAGKKVAETQSKVEEIPSSEDEAEEKPKKGVKVVAPKDKPVKDEKGVPGYWLHALKHNEMIKNNISERDEEVLKFLEDITVEYLDDKPMKGFTLTFHFAENPFFTGSILTKTCFWDQDRKGDDETIEKLEGCDIPWKSSAQNVTVTIKEKKQRHKSGKGVRVVKKEEKAPSFFHFFKPLHIDDEGEVIGHVEEEEDPQELIEQDEDITLAIANNVIPRATFYYTGESLERLAKQLSLQFGMEHDDDDDDDDFEDEEDEDEEEEEVKAPAKGKGKKGAKGGRGGGAPPPPPAECKQQ